MQLFLIRHPPPQIAAGVCYGQLDVPAADPWPIARRLQRLLPEAVPVHASPLQRARHLAEALHAQPQFDARLMEISFGEWEGLPWEGIDRSLLERWAANLLHFTPPGGESVAHLQARVIARVDELRDECCAVVTHAGVIRVVLGHYLSLPVAQWSALPIAFGSLSLLEIDRDRRSGVLHYRNR